eukprot:Lithocolla_globosa_v1_NODE_4758_length_1373_cov_4.795903.p1 type:complete len:207 gc:universal NODE_4758_length_1373_cov_4.795903:697-1317(+)
MRGLIIATPFSGEGIEWKVDGDFLTKVCWMFFFEYFITFVTMNTITGSFADKGDSEKETAWYIATYNLDSLNVLFVAVISLFYGVNFLCQFSRNLKILKPLASTDNVSYKQMERQYHQIQFLIFNMSVGFFVFAVILNLLGNVEGIYSNSPFSKIIAGLFIFTFTILGTFFLLGICFFEVIKKNYHPKNESSTMQRIASSSYDNNE